MMKKYLFWAMFILLGVLSGWMLHSYWEDQMNRAESLLLLNEANEALQKGNMDIASDAALRAATINKKSFLATLMVAELYDKHGSGQLAIRYYKNALALSKNESETAANAERHIQERLSILVKKPIRPNNLN